MRSWERTEMPIVLAHRGGAIEYPENSVEAFQAMEDLGFTYIETDTHATSDGELVLLHDPILDRTTNGSGPIFLKTWDDIIQLTDQSGRRPMLLWEALERFPDVDFNVDLKVDSTVRPMIRLLESGEHLDRLLLASFSERRLRAVRSAVPGVATSVGTSAVIRLILASRFTGSRRRRLLSKIPGRDQGVACVQMPEKYHGIRVLDERLVDMIHGMGLAVHVWTVNEAMDMSRLLNMGVDGLITDRPRLAREVIDVFMSRKYY